MSESFLTQSGNPRNLRVYKVTEVIYDLTYYFTQHYLQRGDRTIDQMVQAARSGKQNIIEGNEAATTSLETNIKLTNVARASLAELLTDYEDYLRVRNLPLWGATHPRYERIRRYARSEELQQEYQALMSRLRAWLGRDRQTTRRGPVMCVTRDVCQFCRVTVLMCNGCRDARKCLAGGRPLNQRLRCPIVSKRDE